MPKVKPITLHTYIQQDTIEVCQAIIEMAKRGEVSGMIFALRKGQNDHGIGMTGAYRDDPLAAKAVVGGLFDLCSELARPLRVDSGKL